MYHEQCKVMYTDTDSLIYLIECDDVYDIMKRDISRFDTNDFAVDNAYDILLEIEFASTIFNIISLLLDISHQNLFLLFLGTLMFSPTYSKKAQAHAYVCYREC